MALIPINNQAINWNSLDECNPIVTDLRCALYELGDTIQVQFRNIPCDESITCAIGMDAGENILADGEFYEYDDWLLGSNTDWNPYTNKLCFDNSSSATTQTIVTSEDTLFWKVRFTISNYESGTFRVGLVGQLVSVYGDSIAGNGTYEQIIKLNNDPTLTLITLVPDSFSACIDDIELYPMTSECWQLDLDWNLSDSNTFCHEAGSASALSYQGTLLTVGVRYKLVVGLSPRTDGVIEATDGTEIIELFDGVNEYYFTAQDTDLIFEADANYDGCVESVELYALDTFTEEEVWLSWDVDNVTQTIDLSGNVTYDRDFATLEFVINELEEGMPETCYKVGYYNHCNYEGLLSNCINVKESQECTMLVTASNTCDAFGFNFRCGFDLTQRVRVTQFNPEYTLTNEFELLSDGSYRKILGQRSKSYTAILDWGDVAVHDCMSLQLLSETLTIDGTEYYFNDNQYVPDWDKDGKNGLALAEIKLLKAGDNLKQTNNCG